jgi:RsiW-degrading membrane proteinase PrsW (M82 family)
MVEFISALVPAILIASLFYGLDRNKEPVKEVIRAFAAGVLSIPVLIIVATALPSPVSEVRGSFGNALSEAFIRAGFFEEAAKYIMFLVAVYFRKAFDEWYDGILYGVMVGLGFAFVENIQYFSDYISEHGAEIVVRRSLLSMPVHALAGGIMGYFLGKSKFTLDEAKIPLLFILALIVPVGIHGFYDFFLMYYEIDLRWLAAPTVIVLWIWVLKMKKVTQNTVIF